MRKAFRFAGSVLIATAAAACAHTGTLPALRTGADVWRDAAYRPSATAAPSSLFYTYNESGAISREMDSAATGSLSNQTLTYAGGEVNANFGWITAPNVPGVSSWPAQQYTVTLEVTQSNAALAITEVKVYRVDAQGGPTTSGLSVVADLPSLNQSLGTAGTKTFSLSGSAQTAAATDRLGVKFYVRNASSASQSFAYQAGSGTASSLSTAASTPGPTATPTALPTPRSSNSPYPAAVLADAPLQYFPLSDASGPSASDLGSARVAGAYIGAVQFGVKGPFVWNRVPAIRLPGGTGNNGVSIANPGAAAGTSYSLETWVYPVLGSTYVTIWGFDGAHRLLVSSTGLLLSQFSGNFFSRGKLAASQWHYIVFTYDASAKTASYYIDGLFDSSAPVPAAAAAFTSPYFLGEYGTGPYYKWNGMLAESAFYRKALTPAQVRTHYIAAGPPQDVPCGGYRWTIKTATDADAPGIDLDDVHAASISSMIALTKPSVNSLTPRSSPVEDSIYRLNNVTLTLVQRAVDNDYHLLVKDAQGLTIITESPDPGCAQQSRLAQRLAAVRSAINAQIPNVSTTALNPNLTISVRGVGFYDYVPNYAVGEAPNGIELHPLTAICFGLNCTLPP